MLQSPIRLRNGHCRQPDRVAGRECPYPTGVSCAVILPRAAGAL
jgi:hypothetical protein